ncbi:hypothetical protein [Sorangium sp. So ce1097]|uniref:hypothetical protein n=1 Tax=Sorangium sp. So ce1097 TaxID=3133330 RepID=UPI003F63D061
MRHVRQEAPPLFASDSGCGVRVRDKTYVYPGERYYLVVRDDGVGNAYYAVPGVNVRPLQSKNFGEVVVRALQIDLPPVWTPETQNWIRRLKFEPANVARVIVNAADEAAPANMMVGDELSLVFSAQFPRGGRKHIAVRAHGIGAARVSVVLQKMNVRIDIAPTGETRGEFLFVAESTLPIYGIQQKNQKFIAVRFDVGKTEFAKVLGAGFVVDLVQP